MEWRAKDIGIVRNLLSKQKIQLNIIRITTVHVFWFFDHGSGHTAFVDDALNVNKMNMHPGGAHPRIRDTYYSGKLQRMVFPDGTPQGMKQLL